MIANSSHFHKMSVLATVLAGLMMASCAGLQQSSPEQVDTSRPTVTYKYQNDEELILANERAAEFCNQYNFAPRPESFSDDQDGSKVVVFECVPSSMPAPQPPVNSNLIYSYRTDQELLNATRSAQTYCTKSGSQQVVSNIVTNADGSRTVTFQCRQ